MIKIDIVKRTAQHLNLKDAEALAVVDAIIESVKETICEHGRLEVRDFGVFQTKTRKSRVGRNPRNRREYPIPPRRVVTFKVGKELKDFSLEKSGPSRVLGGDAHRDGTGDQEPISSRTSAGAPAAAHQDSLFSSDSD